MHVSNLFSEYKSTATALICGSYQISFNVFYAFVSKELT